MSNHRHDRSRGAVLITGAARRIGAAIARGLAAEGWAVVIHCHRSSDEAAALAGEIDSPVIVADLAAADAAERVVGEAVRHAGPLAVLINNAAIFEPDDIMSVNAESWRRHIDINLRAPVFLAREFARQSDGGGNIINIIDQRVLKLNPTFFSYTIAKSALWTATRTLAQSLAPGIRVNAIAPGPALPTTRMSEDDIARQRALTPLGVGPDLIEISRTVRYILRTPSLTGQMIALDGGQHLAWQTPDITEISE